MGEHRRALYLHIGNSKTGTSSLQAGLWASVPALSADGVGVPFVGRPAHVTGLLRPLGWRPGAGFAAPARPQALRQVPERVRSTDGARLLMSSEDLAEAHPEVIGRVVALADEADVDLHLVLTVRDWSTQLPSNYQQFLKQRLTDPYPDFLADVRQRRGRWGELFWRRQDPVDVLDRWGSSVDASRIHVVVVPPYDRDPDGIFDLMAATVGFRSASVVRPATSVNASYGVVESEVLRRVNLALGERLPDFKRDYDAAIRRPFARGVLTRAASPRLTLPPEHLAWVRDRALGTVATIRERGYRVHGDLDRLVPDQASARPLPAYDEAAVAEASVTVLADYAVYLHQQRRASVSDRPAEADRGRTRR